MFRGIRQEIDPGFTSWPYADLKIDFTSGDGAVKSSSVNFGVWNSLHTGSSGTGGPSEKLHYEEDFYAALNLAFAKCDDVHDTVHGVHESEREFFDGQGDPVQGVVGQQVCPVRPDRL